MSKAGRAGAILPFGLHLLSHVIRRERDGSALRDLASLVILGGSFCLRTGVLQDGAESARRPGDAFRRARPNR
jgi:hypothetical protein